MTGLTACCNHITPHSLSMSRNCQTDRRSCRIARSIQNSCPVVHRKIRYRILELKIRVALCPRSPPSTNRARQRQQESLRIGCAQHRCRVRGTGIGFRVLLGHRKQWAVHPWTDHLNIRQSLPKSDM